MLIIGLGNPGKEYEKTRHNVGAMVVEQFAEEHETSLHVDTKIYAQTGMIERQRFVVPTTFMNNSGQAVTAAMRFFDSTPNELVVIHDDLDVPLGEVRMKFGGGTAGHNGVASVAHHLNTPEFWRIRIGIGPIDDELVKFRANDTAGFVLAPFQADEEQVVQGVIDMVCSTLIDWINNPSERTITFEKGTHGEIEA